MCPVNLDPKSLQPARVSLSRKDYITQGLGLKFYNLHQTLNTSINALNSFTDIYLISSARSGFVFFISFTSFFLTLICPHHILSGMSCQACCLWLGAAAPSQVSCYHGSYTRSRGQGMLLTSRADTLCVLSILTPEPMAWDLPYFATLVQGSSLVKRVRI